MAKTIRPPKAPNLPVGPIIYEQQYQNLLNNSQRLYYNQIDNAISSLMENSGGRFLNFPHVFVYGANSQYALGDNTPTLVNLSTVSRNEGFDLTATSANPIYSGAYRIDYRLQFENNDASNRSVWVWLVVNSSPVTASCSKFTVPTLGYIMASGFIELDLTGADTVQLYWATDKAAVSGGATGVWMDAYASSTSPFVRPAIPSSYGSITFVSELSE